MQARQLELAELKRDWIERTVEVVQGLARAGALPQPDWSSDELHALVAEQPAQVNWWGCLVAKLRNKRLIYRTGSKPSSRPEANGRWVGTWKFKAV